jgi:hypothetical protein
MRLFSLLLVLTPLLLAACSPSGENRQVPTINGVPVYGGGIGGGGVGMGR